MVLIPGRFQDDRLKMSAGYRQRLERFFKKQPLPC